ncbi:MAG TPA: phage tail protein [Planctomycetota bacterium]|nr:phage tail protein [Planctomycetota bacterium]
MAKRGFPFCGNFNFLVEIEDLEGEPASVVGGFTEVSGLSTESPVLEYRVGSHPTAVKIPGRTTYGNVRLRKGVTTSSALWEWRRRIEAGEEDLRSGSIVLLDSAMRERARWNFYGAWPCRYEAPLFDAESEGLSVETVELCVERLERVDTPKAASGSA